MKTLNTETYSVSEPYYNQNGASMTIYFKDDSYMELDVDMSWSNRTDTVEIDRAIVNYYDYEGDELDVVGVDVEEMIIKICEHFNTFGNVENEMAKSYIADHE